VNPIIDIYIEKNGIIVILFKFLRFGISLDNEIITLEFCIYKIGVTLGLIKAEENLCQETK
jgi:hypothetical protein